MKKERLDVLLVNRGMFESRAKAQAAVMAGQVLVNEQKIDKPGTPVAPEVTIRLLGNKLPYVSRGGLKLEKAMQVFPMRPDGKVCMDIGASTGGFTDCMLQNGALGSLMSGSGPTVFGIFDDKDKAMAAKEKCRELPYRCFVFVTDLYR